MSSLKRPAINCRTMNCKESQYYNGRCRDHHKQHLAELHAQQSAAKRKQKYGKQWQRTRHHVLDRDGHACIHCGNPNSLEVHHINGESNHPSNLVTLCRSCHGKAGSVEIIRSIHRWLGE